MFAAAVLVLAAVRAVVGHEQEGPPSDVAAVEEAAGGYRRIVRLENEHV